MATDVLDLEEVAKWLHVNPWTIYRLVKEGKIPGFKVGNQWRFKRDTLERWMDRQSSLELHFDQLLERLRREGVKAGITEEDIERAVREVRSLLRLLTSRNCHSKKKGKGY